MRRPWMPLYVGDYLADTRHLTTVEHGAYVLLIMHYWRTGGLPNDDARLANICGLTHDAWASSRGVIAAFFDANWKHKRIEHELAEAEKLSTAGRAGGLASGKARRERTRNEQPLNDPPNGLRTKREASQSQSPSSEANASDAFASEPPDARLWREGLPALMALGVKERQARPMIGRWRRDAGDDCERVLDAILRARESCPFDPIPWINASLKDRTNAKTSTVIAAADKLVERIRELDKPASDIRGGEGAAVVRLLPQGGRQ